MLFAVADPSTLYVRAPDGTVGTVPAAEYQRALNHGYTNVTEDEARQALGEHAAGLAPAQAAAEGVGELPEGYNAPQAFAEKALSAATFGLAPGLNTPEAVASGRKFSEEHPYAAFGAEVLGQLPLAVATGALGEAAVGGAAAAGLGRAAMAGVRVADFGAQALLGGAQTEAEQTRLAQDEFSWTDAAVAGVAGEALGRGAAAGIGAVGRNLLRRGVRDTVAADASSALTRGGVLNDFRVAHHADQYQNELATLAADDLDRLETSFTEVSRQDRKRARVVRVVEDRPEAQAAIRQEALAGLADLRAALAAELGETLGGPARALLRQLDDRAEALAETRGGAKRLWRLLDENRQALQEYAQDLHQAYENAPGSAWLSRDGLTALDAAEKSTREALLREDVWGRAAAEAQAAYNTPFHEKYFPTAKTVRGKLMFTTQNDARGFPVFRGDPARVRAFFTRNLGDVDAARLGEQFTQYLDGVEAIARAGEIDTPRAARDTLEAVRRLRKAASTAEFVQHAAARTGRRGEVLGVGVEAALGAGGALAAGPAAGAAIFGGLRAARAGDFVLRAARRLGWGAGEAESMARILGKDELAGVAARDAEPNIADDLVDGSEPPPSGGGGAPPAPPPPAGGGAGGLTPSMRADAARASWAPSAPPGATAPEEIAGPASIAAPPSPREAPTRPVPGGAPEVHRGTAEALETDALREAGVAGRAETRRLEALTEGEFRDVVRQLRASDAPNAKDFADRLAASEKDLVDAGWVEPPREAPTLDEVDEFYRRRTAESAPPAPRADAAVGAATEALRDLGLQIRMGQDRLGETLDTVFGAGRAPTPEQWKQIIPLDTLARLGPAERARIDVLGDAFIWSAEGPAADRFSEEAWRISRTFARNDEGRLEVHHDHFFIRDDLQGTGVGAQVLREMMEAYRKVGVDKVSVDAIQVGRYFWPSIGFNCGEDALRQAKSAYEGYVRDILPPNEAQKALAEIARVRSLPALAQVEYGKDFLLSRNGPWNYDLHLELEDRNPLYHLMRGRLDVGAAAALAVGGELEGAFRDPREKENRAAVAGVPFGATALLLKQGRGRLVRDVARRLFSAAAEPAARVTARLAYSRAQLDARREEISSWAENPQALVDRVAEGLRDAPSEAFASASQGVFAAAAYLREKLPQPYQPSPVALGRGVPVSAEAAAKYARYEQAALRPGEAWREAAESGYISPELLETTQELYPDLLAEVRVEAYQAIRAGGPPRTIQAKAQYARLFDGDGTMADAAFSPTAVQMVNYAYEQAAAVAPPKPSEAGVSQTAVAVAAPRPWAPVA